MNYTIKRSVFQKGIQILNVYTVKIDHQNKGGKDTDIGRNRLIHCNILRLQYTSIRLDKSSS